MKEQFLKLINEPIRSTERIFNGRNSQVYKVICENNKKYIVKNYFQNKKDTRARLSTEFYSLKFLWGEGARNIPEPIVCDKENNLGVYEFIEGKKIKKEEVTDKDVLFAVDFLEEINKYKTKASQIQPASEAFFTTKKIIDNIQNRIERLERTDKKEENYFLLSTFLSNELKPFFKELVSWCDKKLEKSGKNLETELSEEEKILSPSDYGFHNALRKEDNSIVFLDFEYFGWDDPTKTISDFILHPAMNLEEQKKHLFVREFLNRFQDHKCLKERLEIIYPLFGIKWCTIFLNEFVPENLSRRKFAEERIDVKTLQLTQLEKAKQLLELVKTEYENFKYTK